MILLVVLCLGIGSRAQAADEPLQKWDSLLDVTYKFSWYPRADLQKLLEMKAAEYGQTLEEYRAALLTEVTGGRPPTKLRTDDFVSGLPWRDYYRLSMAEFCPVPRHGAGGSPANAEQRCRCWTQKNDQPEIDFWHYVLRAHGACLAKDRDGFIDAIYHLWQNVVIRASKSSPSTSPPAPQPAGFARDLPFLYENVAHLVLRKAILEKEIPDLYPLNALILDIQPKLTVENGYKTMVDQVVERMQGPDSDNHNLNFAVALLEATASATTSRTRRTRRSWRPSTTWPASTTSSPTTWADTGKGKAAILVQHMGFMNYIVRRLTDPADALAANPFFHTMPYTAWPRPAGRGLSLLSTGWPTRRSGRRGRSRRVRGPRHLSQGDAPALGRHRQAGDRRLRLLQVGASSRVPPRSSRRPGRWSSTADCSNATPRRMPRSSPTTPIS